MRSPARGSTSSCSRRATASAAASGRSGSRTASVIERGAEFVLPGYETMRETRRAARARLPREGDALRRPRAARRAAGHARRAARCGGAAPRGARRVARRRDRQRSRLSQGARAAIASRLAVSTAYELDDQPASILADGAAGFGAFPSHGIEGGNDLLARALAASLDVRLGRRVERVAWDEQGVTADGERADVCVVATPAHAVAFDPPLPEWKQQALAAVRYGQAAKLFLQLERGGRAERDAVGSRTVLDVDRARLARRRRRSRARAPRSSASSRERAGAVGGGGPPAPARSSVRRRRAGPRDVARRRVLGALALVAARRRRAGRAGRPDRVRRRAHGRRVARPDGRGAAQRPAGRRAVRSRRHGVEEAQLRAPRAPTSGREDPPMRAPPAFSRYRWRRRSSSSSRRAATCCWCRGGCRRWPSCRLAYRASPRTSGARRPAPAQACEAARR